MKQVARARPSRAWHPRHKQHCRSSSHGGCVRIAQRNRWMALELPRKPATTFPVTSSSATPLGIFYSLRFKLLVCQSDRDLHGKQLIPFRFFLAKIPFRLDNGCAQEDAALPRKQRAPPEPAALLHIICVVGSRYNCLRSNMSTFLNFSSLSFCGAN